MGVIHQGYRCMVAFCSVHEQRAAPMAAPNPTLASPSVIDSVLYPMHVVVDISQMTWTFKFWFSFPCFWTLFIVPIVQGCQTSCFTGWCYATITEPSDCLCHSVRRQPRPDGSNSWPHQRDGYGLSWGHSLHCYHAVDAWIIIIIRLIHRRLSQSGCLATHRLGHRIDPSLMCIKKKHLWSFCKTRVLKSCCHTSGGLCSSAIVIWNL